MSCGNMVLQLKPFEKSFYIIFDASIPQSEFLNKDAFVVFLKTPSHVNKERSPHPSIKWAQESDNVVSMIDLPSAKDMNINLESDDYLYFRAKLADEDMPYELCFKLYDAVNKEKSKKAVRPKTICYHIKKADGSKWWPRLLKKEGKPPVFLKVDSKPVMKGGYEDIERLVNRANKDAGESKEHEGPTEAAEKAQP
ncbi:hypothetical protein BAE44_0005629 [Dichanthelium oligosanthes]|uniref:Co-chaperone protein p23 n=1 Tax=Dichanthelium oligosanthes TaxID=888268 RepID=A0A1E5W7J4_9POAL|nr:hypothetical protein BAE44_0005629 [Dichanthelium oligosanthes]